MVIDLSQSAAKTRDAESPSANACHARDCKEEPVAIIISCTETMATCFPHYKNLRLHMAKGGKCPHCGITAAVCWEVTKKPEKSAA